MKHHLIEIVRATASLLLALALCTLFGAFSGYWHDPDTAHRIEQGMRAYAKRNPSASPEDLAAFYATLDPQPRPAPPPVVIAIIKSNASLVLPCMFASLLLLRPRLKPAVLVGLIGSVFVAISLGLTIFLLFLAAYLLYGLILMLFPWLLRRAA